MADGSSFSVERRREAGTLVLVPQGDLDIAAVDRMRMALAERHPDEALRIDLSALDFLDTSGLQLIVEAQRRARDEGFALSLVPGTAQVQRVFEIAGLDRVLPFGDDA